MWGFLTVIAALPLVAGYGYAPPQNILRGSPVEPPVPWPHRSDWAFRLSNVIARHNSHPAGGYFHHSLVSCTARYFAFQYASLVRLFDLEVDMDVRLCVPGSVGDVLYTATHGVRPFDGELQAIVASNFGLILSSVSFLESRDINGTIYDNEFSTCRRTTEGAVCAGQYSLGPYVGVTRSWEGFRSFNPDARAAVEHATKNPYLPAVGLGLLGCVLVGKVGGLALIALACTPVTLVLGSMPVALFAFVAYKTRSRSVRVAGPRSNIDTNAAKDYFANLKKLRGPRSRKGAHLSLAWQRRTAEEACFDYLYQSGYAVVRDIGGSRTRHTTYGMRKHICSAVNANADILREEKSPDFFPNCRMPGQFCPYRKDIPAAILSHVDYYLTQEELLACITGPTFVINHSFGPSGTGGKYAKFGGKEIMAPNGDMFTPPEGHEAEWTNSGGIITMQAPDGTPYEHPFHVWQSEGEIVAGGMAATYARMCVFKDTNIYLVRPSPGQYDAFASTNMRDSQDDDLVIDTGSGPCHVAYLNPPEQVPVYVYSVAGRADVKIPAALPHAAATKLANIPRDAKFDPTITNYIMSQLRSISTELEGSSDLVKNHVLHILPKITLNNALARREVGLTPLEASLMDIYTHRVSDWVVKVLPYGLASLIARIPKNGLGLAVARMVGVVHRVPSYEVFSPQIVSATTGHNMKPRFRVGSPPNSARNDGGAECGPTQKPNERASKRGNQSSQPSSRSPSVSDDESYASDDDLGTELRGEWGPNTESPVGFESDSGHCSGPSGAENGSDVPDAIGSGLGDDDIRRIAEDLEQYGWDTPPPELVHSGECPPVDHPEDERVQSGSQEGEEGEHGSATHAHFDEAGRFSLDDELDGEVRENASGYVVQCRSAKLLTGGEHGHAIKLQVDLGERIESAKIVLRRKVRERHFRGILGLLRSLPRLDRGRVQCALSWAVRAIGYSMQPCHCANVPTGCISMRVRYLAPNERAPPGYRAVIVGDVAYAIPDPEAPTTTRGKGRLLNICGPYDKGCKGGLLPQGGDNNEDDGSSQHQSQERHVPRDNGTVRGGARGKASPSRRVYQSRQRSQRARESREDGSDV